MTVFVNSEIEIPNTFSPNGDNNNDTWVIEGIEGFPNALVQIYNRWGADIFSTIGYNNVTAVWDGTSSRGRPLTEGVYFYVIELRDGANRVFNGTITIIR